MRTRPRSSIVVLALLLTLIGGGVAQAGPQAQLRAAAIRLKAATITPGLGLAATLPAGLNAAERPGQRGYYIVQFGGPIQQAWKDQVAAQGAELLDYLPDFAFKARMTPAVARQVAASPNVSWVGLFQPAYKLSPDLKRGATELYQVRIERGADAAAATSAVVLAGAQVLGRNGNLLLVAASGTQLGALAGVADVAAVENYTLYEKHNEFGGGAIIKGGIANSRGYDGSTQIAAVADTGLGGGTTTTAHRDIPAGRIVAIQNFPGVTDSCFQSITNDGAVDVDSGHGTHTTGSVLSGGDPITGAGKGVAPAARLVFQALENFVTTSNLCKLQGVPNDYYLTGLNDLNNVFLTAYNAGARVHSNSWGSASAGAYTADSATADNFIWGHKDMTITFSAGNEGADANADGVVDSGSLGAPASAKNVISVGASENDRQGNYQCDTALTYVSADTTYQNGQTCTSMGGQNLLGTPRQRWGFTANPIADDPTAGNAQQMAAFSSRGPADDGRIKPDVVAPGTWVLSTYSSQFQQGYGTATNPRTGAFQSDGWGIPANSLYKYFGGTSMANPLAAGGATVVRDFYQKVYTVNASAALVKATLINSAVDLLDENNDGINDNDFPIPNVHEGWGLINLDAATDGTAQFIDNATGLSTGGTASSAYTAPGGAPLKISLVWSDFPSTTTAAVNLVNNLNLTVTGPGGVTYRGNVFNGGWSTTGGVADAVNNVENVYVQSAAAGTWTATVTAANVPQGPQPFALVVRGGTAAVVAPPAAPSGLTATAASSSQINLAWVDGSADETGFKIERCAGAGCTTFAQVALVGANVTSFSDTGLSASTSYSYRVRATNSGGDSAFSNTASAATQAAPATPAAPSNLTATTLSRTQIRLNWTDNATNETGFKIERCTGATCTNFAQIGTAGANAVTFTSTGLTRNTTYRFRVRATNAAGDSAYTSIVNAATQR
jgi:subtilisin family serine protease